MSIKLHKTKYVDKDKFEGIKKYKYFHESAKEHVSLKISIDKGYVYIVNVNFICLNNNGNAGVKDTNFYVKYIDSPVIDSSASITTICECMLSYGFTTSFHVDKKYMHINYTNLLKTKTFTNIVVKHQKTTSV